MNLGRVGAWLGTIGMLPAAEERVAVRALEAAGFETIWFGENPFNKKAMCGAEAITSIKRSEWGMKAGIANSSSSDDVKLVIPIEAYKDQQ